MFSIHSVQLMEQLSEIELRKWHNKRGKKLVKDIKYNVSTYISLLQEIKMGVTLWKVSKLMIGGSGVNPGKVMIQKKRVGEDSPTRFSTYCTYYFIISPSPLLTVPAKKICTGINPAVPIITSFSSLTLIIPAVPMVISSFSDTDHSCCSYGISSFSLKLTVLEKNFFCTITLPGFTPQPLIINSLTFHKVTPILISWYVYIYICMYDVHIYHIYISTKRILLM